LVEAAGVEPVLNAYFNKQSRLYTKFILKSF